MKVSMTEQPLGPLSMDGVPCLPSPDGPAAEKFLPCPVLRLGKRPHQKLLKTNVFACGDRKAPRIGDPVSKCLAYARIDFEAHIVAPLESGRVGCAVTREVRSDVQRVYGGSEIEAGAYTLFLPSQQDFCSP